MAIERFQAFAVFKNHRHITRWLGGVARLCRKFSIGWFLSSWTLAILFVMILLPQIQETEPGMIQDRDTGLIRRAAPSPNTAVALTARSHPN